ncbi:hypothetical protein D3C72_2463300 [compost metagenome]
MNHVHQQRNHHRLLGEAIGTDGSSQRIQQCLQENPAADNIHIDLGMNKNIALHIQCSQQITAE